MPSAAAAVRRQIEAALEARIPSALTPRPPVLREHAATEVPEIDPLLEGGLPVGAITELVGPPCSGRTTLAQAVLAGITAAGKAVAWVDASDTLDPESAAAAGIDLSRQLWVRCGGSPQTEATHSSTQLSAKSSGNASVPHQGAALITKSSLTPASSGGCGSPHPRGEARGLSKAIGALMQPDTFARRIPPRGPDPHKPDPTQTNLLGNKGIGTPDAAIRRLTDTPARQSQSLAGFGKFTSPVWKALDQALRATDLLLAAGGFSAIVIDLGNTPPEFAWRIPLATWFRFRAGAERSRTVLMVLTQHPCTRSSAELVLRLSPATPQTANTVLIVAGFQITIDRQRFEAPNPAENDRKPSPQPLSPPGESVPEKLHLVPPRKPPQRERATSWQRPSAWAQGANWSQPQGANWSQPQGASWSQPQGASWSQPPGASWSQPQGASWSQPPDARSSQPPGVQ